MFPQSRLFIPDGSPVRWAATTFSDSRLMAPTAALQKSLPVVLIAERLFSHDSTGMIALVFARLGPWERLCAADPMQGPQAVGRTLVDILLCRQPVLASIAGLRNLVVARSARAVIGHACAVVRLDSRGWVSLALRRFPSTLFLLHWSCVSYHAIFLPPFLWLSRLCLHLPALTCQVRLENAPFSRVFRLSKTCHDPVAAFGRFSLLASSSRIGSARVHIRCLSFL
jgi:hypothetical protein